MSTYTSSGQTWSSKWREALQRYERKGSYLVMPAVIALVLINALPIVLLLYMSVTEWDSLQFGARPFVGLSNYIEILQDPRFQQDGITTLIWIFGSIAIEIPLGLTIALALYRAEERGLLGFGIFRSLYLIPISLAPVVVGVLWRFLYNAQTGLINYILGLLGISPVDWLGSSVALLAIIIVDVWEYTPLYILMILSGLQSIPKSLHEAAEVDGATYWQQLRYITIPLLKNVILTVSLVRAIDLLRWLVTIFIMTGGGPGTTTEIWNMYLYNLVFVQFNVGKGAAMGVIMVVASIILMYFFYRFSQAEETR